MASISTDGATGRRTIQFAWENGTRRSIRLGKVNQKQAESAKSYIEDLLACKSLGSAPQPRTADWVARLPDTFRQRLERAELIEPQKRKRCPVLADWVREYIAGRTDIKPNTRRNMKRAETNLLDFFGKTKPLDEVSPGDAEEFRRRLLEQGLAEATVRRRCKRVKQFFATAVKKRMLSENPFEAIPTADRVNTSRQYFVSRKDIALVIDACPDMEWRLIFALARFGGIRTPSELLPLTWDDINWAEDRFLVHSPKTEHIEGKESRMVPLFPELRSFLLEAYEQAQPGQKYLITRYRHPGVNPGPQARRIIKRAGLVPWPKTFQNLRASRETELVEYFPVHVVSEWLGNSPQIAAKHYLQVTEDHFKKAVHFPVQHLAAQGHFVSHNEMDENDELTYCQTAQKDATPCNNKELHSVPLRGFEPRSPG
jgi:integrase